MKLDSNISAIVTGGSSGLGEGTARGLASRGVKVAIFDTNEDSGKKIASEIKGVFIPCNVADSKAVTKALEAARAENGIERLVVNCAGVAPAAKTVSRGAAHDAELYSKIIGINLIGSFNVASQSAAAMVAEDPLADDGERGLIINTASVAAFDGQIGQIAYASSKGGIAAMTLPMARDLADKGIRVVTIAPGIFETPMLAGMPQEVQDALAASIPFPSRLGRASEYAELAMHIAENRMFNGEVVRLDGAIRMPPR